MSLFKDISKSKKGAYVSREFALFNLSKRNISDLSFIGVISLIIIRKRQHGVSLITKQKQICKKGAQMVPIEIPTI